MLAIAFCCRYVNILPSFFDASDPFFSVIYPMLKSIVRHLIHISLVLAWCLSVYSRILDRRIRNLLMSAGFLILLWLLVRTCKWDFVPSYQIGFVRYLWYAYYVPIILLPLQGVFVADMVGRPEDYRLPRWMKWLYLPAALLILLVFTNDLHEAVFSFPQGITLYDDAYQHEWLYYLVIGWVVALALWFIASVLRKSHVPGDKKIQKLPFMVMLGFILVWIVHTFKLFPNDQTVLNCFLIILLLESQIQTGLIRSNSNYDNLFRKSTIAAQIVDASYRPRYVSGSAMDADIKLMLSAESDVVRSGDVLIHNKPITGGRVLWQDNITEINMILEQLQDAREQLGQAYELQRAEVNLRERRFRAEEKSRLYDQIAREISPQLVKADEILKQVEKNPSESKRLLAQVCVICAYIKRLSNLLLIGEEQKRVPAAELESCLRESTDNLYLANVMSFLEGRCEGEISAAVAADVYRLFEAVTECLLDRMSALLIRVNCKNGKIRMQIQIGCHTSPGDVALPELKCSSGSFTCEVQDEDVILHGSFDGGDLA